MVLDKRHFRIHKITCQASWPTGVAALLLCCRPQCAAVIYLLANADSHRWPHAPQPLSFLFHIFYIRNSQLFVQIWMRTWRWNTPLSPFCGGMCFCLRREWWAKKWETSHRADIRMAPKVLLMDYPTAVRWRKDKKYTEKKVINFNTFSFGAGYRKRWFIDQFCKTKRKPVDFYTYSTGGPAMSI